MHHDTTTFISGFSIPPWPPYSCFTVFNNKFNILSYSLFLQIHTHTQQVYPKFNQLEYHNWPNISKYLTPATTNMKQLRFNDTVRQRAIYWIECLFAEKRNNLGPPLSVAVLLHSRKMDRRTGSWFKYKDYNNTAADDQCCQIDTLRWSTIIRMVSSEKKICQCNLIS